MIIMLTGIISLTPTKILNHFAKTPSMRSATGCNSLRSRHDGANGLKIWHVGRRLHIVSKISIRNMVLFFIGSHMPKKGQTILLQILL